MISASAQFISSEYPYPVAPGTDPPMKVTLEVPAMTAAGSDVSPYSATTTKIPPGPTDVTMTPPANAINAMRTKRAIPMQIPLPP